MRGRCPANTSGQRNPRCLVQTPSPPAPLPRSGRGTPLVLVIALGQSAPLLPADPRPPPRYPTTAPPPGDLRSRRALLRCGRRARFTTETRRAPRRMTVVEDRHAKAPRRQGRAPGMPPGLSKLEIEVVELERVQALLLSAEFLRIQLPPKLNLTEHYASLALLLCALAPWREAPFAFLPLRVLLSPGSQAPPGNKRFKPALPAPRRGRAWQAAGSQAEPGNQGLAEGIAASA